MSDVMADPVKWEMWLRNEGFISDKGEDPDVLAVDLSYLEEEDQTVHTAEKFMDPQVIHIVQQLREVTDEDLYAEETIQLMDEAMNLFMATPSKEEAAILSNAREEVTSRQVDNVLNDCRNSIERMINENLIGDDELGEFDRLILELP